MISVKVLDLKKLIRKVSRTEKTLQANYKVFIERLGKVGYETASIRFQKAQYDGINDVVVGKPKWIDSNKMEITANGKAVAFIEFGTGIFYKEIHPTASKVGAIRGSYGQGKGNQVSWGYYGEAGTNGRVIQNSSGREVVITKGNPPAMALHLAIDEMRNNILQIAKEVFR